MKLFSQAKVLSPFALGLVLSMQSHALDQEALLIDKLNQVYLKLSAQDSSRIPITLRLADLYSEKARKKDLEAGKTGDPSSQESAQDRKKAISLYEEVLEQLKGEQKGKVLIQVAHLYQMNDQDLKAKSYYERVTKENLGAVSLAEAHFSIGEIQFKMNDFAGAVQSYEKILSQETNHLKGRSAYRWAWAKFQAGQNKPAIDGLVKILTTPQLQSKDNSGVKDDQFLEEVTQDLITFTTTRGQVTDAEIAQIEQLSPAKSVELNMVILARELERLGDVAHAQGAWRRVLAVSQSPGQKLEAYVSLFDLNRGQKNSSAASENFRSAVNIASTIENCEGMEKCKFQKSRLLKSITDLHKIERQNPSQELVDYYTAYLERWPKETEVRTWLAESFEKRKDYASAFSEISKALTNPPNNSTQLENMLILQLSYADASNDSALKSQAYANYLNQSQEKSKLYEVKYQQARLIYDQKNYLEASEKFDALAVDAKTPSQLREQSSELALDALVLAKRNDLIKPMALRYATQFKGNSEHFNDIAATAVLNDVETMAHNNQTREALAQIQGVTLSQIPQDKQLTLTKNKVILLEKLNEYPQALTAAQDLSRLKGLSAEDQDFAQTKISWYSELLLDFKGSYEAALKIKNPVGDRDAWNLKLALLADLAELNSQKNYESLVASAKDNDIRAAAAAALVEKAEPKLPAISKYAKALALQPELYEGVVLSALQTENSEKDFKTVAAMSPKPSERVLKTLSKYNLIGLAQKLDEKLKSSNIRTDKQKSMTADIKARVALLAEGEKLANQAIELGDLTAQVYMFQILSRENQRFYSDLMGLPMVDGLSEEEQNQYLMALSQQADPYQVKAKQVGEKLQEFLQSQALADDSKKLAQMPERDLGLMETDKKVLSAIAPQYFTGAIAQKNSDSSTGSVDKRALISQFEQAKRELRDRPLDLGITQKMIEIGKQMGSTKYVGYLEARKKTLSAKANSDAGVVK